MRFAFIEQHAATYPARLMYRVLEVSPSGYYAWRTRPEGPRSTENRFVLGEIRRLQAGHGGRYGSTRMHAALRAEGHRCSRGRVERVMRRHRVRALAGRRSRPCTTDSRHHLAVAPNLLAQRFEAPASNRVWLADLTSIPTGEGWLYLGAVPDPASVKGRIRCMRGFKSFASAQQLCRSYDELRNFVRLQTRHKQHVTANRRRLLHLHRAITALAIFSEWRNRNRPSSRVVRFGASADRTKLRARSLPA